MAAHKLLGFVVLSFLVLSVCSLRRGKEDHYEEEDSVQGPVIRSVTYDNNDWQVHDGFVPGAVAVANFSNAIDKTGWSYLEITTNETYPDEIQAYAAGIVETNTTKKLIINTWVNQYMEYCESDTSKYCDFLETFFKDNINWMNSMFKMAEQDPFWHQMKLLLIQLNGIEDGYLDQHLGPHTTIDDPLVYFFFQVFGDVEDLEEVYDSKHGLPSRKPLGSGSCSALIKLLPGFSDLFVAHDTWSGFETMVRVLKKYDFGFHRTASSPDVIPGRVITFSSYPGTLFSGDDYYLLSSGMTTLETTIGNGNAALWDAVQPWNSVMEGFRSMIANRLATDGKDWTRWFSMYQSGTYNNEWMIVDYRKFTPGQKPQPGLLTVLEQIPTLIHTEDLTDLLVQQMYFPSYNIPYFKDVFNKSGVPASVEKYGPWFGYETSPRGQIFKRNQGKVTDLNTMIRLMRYNDFQHDPLSKCNCTPPYSGENGISARSDLNPANGTYPFGALGHRGHGGTDMKVTSAALFAKGQFYAQCGPTFDQQTPFQWSKTDLLLPHKGHPDLFRFEPVLHQWNMKFGRSPRP